MMVLQHAKRRNSLQVLLVWICIMIPVSAMLYGTSASVRAKENELTVINAQIGSEKDSLRVLRAEWAYLNQPQKLAQRASRYLTAKKAAAPAQVLSERQITAKVAYRQLASTVVSNNSLYIGPANRNTSDRSVAPRLLAKAIVYDDHALASLHTTEEAKLPSAVTWSQKIVSAFGLSGGSQAKNRLAP